MRHIAFFVLLCLAVGSASATSVEPPDFAELVREAETVVRGEVTRVRTELRKTDSAEVPVTLVTFRVDRALVGREVATLELEFLGGSAGGRTLEVGGQPEFSVGDRDVLFVQGNGRQITPLVRMMYGRYLLHEDGKAMTIARSNGAPLAAVADVATALTDESRTAIRTVHRPASTGAITLAAFEEHILVTARELGRKDVAP